MKTNPGLLYYRFYLDPYYRLPRPDGTSETPVSDQNAVALLLNEVDKKKKSKTEQDKIDKDASEHLRPRNDALYSFKLDKYPQPKLSTSNAESTSTAYRQLISVNLTTRYPGLLCGTGYNHEIAAKEAHILGYFFDHTTGLPLIPGSSVKGAIRAVFPLRDHQRAAEAKKQLAALESKEVAERKLAAGRQQVEFYTAQAEGKTNYLTSVLADIAPDLPPERITALEEEVFESYVRFAGKGENGEDYLAAIPTPHRVIFHDAHVSASKKRLFGPDYITPHKNNNIEKNGIPDRYVEPVPVSMLKVMPGVSYSFKFVAPHQYRITLPNGRAGRCKTQLTPTELRKLFERILLDWGVGAKTRVGYGHFDPVGEAGEVAATPPKMEEPEELADLLRWEKERPRPATSKQVKTPPRTATATSSLEGDTYIAEVHAKTKSKPGKRLIFDTAAFDPWRSPTLDAYQVGDRLEVRVIPKAQFRTQVESIQVIRKLEQ